MPLTLFVRDLVLADRPGTQWLVDLLSRQSVEEAGPTTATVAGDDPTGEGPPGAGDAEAEGAPAAPHAAEQPQPPRAAPEPKP
ncbi:MAG: hypothetical protein EHM52_05965 [Actinomycetota bacterium]|nr:MAG: hypothetical protein EHM52_05965 [Actinomycetota bacterium]